MRLQPTTILPHRHCNTAPHRCGQGDPPSSSAPDAHDTDPDEAPESNRETPASTHGPSVAAGYESVDELLHQTAELTLRLLRMEEVLSALDSTLADVREEMHAGFIQTSHQVAQPGQKTRKSNSVVVRLSEIEHQATQVSTTQSRLSFLMVLQLVLLLFVLGICVFGFFHRSLQEPGQNGPTVSYMPEPKQDSASSPRNESEQPEQNNESVRKRRRTRR
ncbi:MAG: hypothetical protein R3C68_04950 [Myxococcota bacterium]